MKRAITTLLVLLLPCAFVVAKDVSEDFSAAVLKAVTDFPAAIGTGDAARIGSMYAADAMLFPPNSEMLKGREAIQAFWKGIIDAKLGVKIETVDTESEDDIGIEVGKYMIMDAAGATVDQGKYVVVWKKGEDGWKLYRDIWNTSVPLPPAK